MEQRTEAMRWPSKYDNERNRGAIEMEWDSKRTIGREAESEKQLETGRGKQECKSSENDARRRFEESESRRDER